MNIALLVSITILPELCGVSRCLATDGVRLAGLPARSAVIGSGAALPSPARSRRLAKVALHIRLIDQPHSVREHWLLATVAALAIEYSPHCARCDAKKENDFREHSSRSSFTAADPVRRLLVSHRPFQARIEAPQALPQEA